MSRLAVHLSKEPERRARWLGIVLLALALSTFLAGCGASGGGLSNVQASTGTLVPGSEGIGRPPGAVEVRYTLGAPTDVTAKLEGPAAATLLSERQDGGDHILRFTGIVTDSETVDGYQVVRRVVPAGDYTIVLSAGNDSQSVRFKVGNPVAQVSQPPSIENVVVQPSTISPNSDATDDQAQVTFRTSETTTITVDLTARDGTRTIQYAPKEKGPGEQNIAVNGQDLEGNVLPDGTYTLTVRLQDLAGNETQAQRPLTIQGGGEPSIAVLKVEIAPQQITLGSAIAVSITVKNTGNVPLRTQGPDRGFTYTTNDSYSSIEGGKYADQAGLWRVGVDWDGNAGGAPYRYPFRWGFGKTLMPGETVTTGGRIVILKQERTMWFYAGVLQEGVRIVVDRVGRTRIQVSF